MMSISKTIYTLKQKLAGRYQLAEERHNLCGRHICVTCVEDAEALFSRKIVPDPGLDEKEESLPFWACLWPSALSLAQVLVSSNYLRPGQTVLELGAGLGLISAVACLKRASVTASDGEAEALAFTRVNCLQIAGVDPEVMTLDWLHPPEDRRFEVILGSDVIYDARFFNPLINCFEVLLEPDGHVYLSEPNREMSRIFFDRLEEHRWRFEVISEEPDASVYCIFRGR